MRSSGWLVVMACAGMAAACDKEDSAAPTVFDAGAQPPAAAAPPVPVEPPKAPEIIVDAAKISIGTEQVTVGEPGLTDKLSVLLTGRPGVAGQILDVVVMRNARPSRVQNVVRALGRAGARGINAKSETRDGVTESLPLSLVGSLSECATVAWIAKDAAIDVWPAGGGRAKRIIKGMAGPDMTLGVEAVAKQETGCSAPEMAVGSDDRFTWGLVFDLATMSLHTPGGRARAAVLVDDAVPGRKLVLETP